MKSVRFKSDQENFRKEYLGIKPNTIRKIDPDDHRFDVIDEFYMRKLNMLVIEIVSPMNELFRRKVMDVTYYQGYALISWDESTYNMPYTKLVSK